MRKGWCRLGLGLVKEFEICQSKAEKKGPILYGVSHTIANLRDLAQGNACGGSLDLRLAIAQGAHNGGRNNLRANNLTIGSLGSSRIGSATRQDDNLDRLALGGPVAVVQVVEVARQTLVPDSRAAQSQRAVAASREASRVDGTGLGRGIELELVVGRNVTSARLAVGQDTAREGGDEVAITSARVTLLYSKKEEGMSDRYF